MNHARLKLVLAVVWLVPGAALLVAEVCIGRVIAALPLGTARLPLSWIFLFFAVFNFLRWWVGRSARDSSDRWRSYRDRPPRRRADTDVDETFRFDDPPP